MNLDILGRFISGDDWQSRHMSELLRVARRNQNLAHWNKYVENWSIVLDALRQLWETGKVSELKTPFYEPSQKPAS
jgi:hypothetical protein